MNASRIRGLGDNGQRRDICTGMCAGRPQPEEEGVSEPGRRSGRQHHPLQFYEYNATFVVL